MSNIQIAMYKGDGKIGNAVTRYWTRSQYSHCELVIDGVCRSSSFMDGGVRSKVIDLEDGKWELVGIPWGDEKNILQFFDFTKGSGYDWAGIFGSQLLNRRFQNPHRFFCSEWVAAALSLPTPEIHSPQSLLSLCQYLNVKYERDGYARTSSI